MARKKKNKKKIDEQFSLFLSLQSGYSVSLYIDERKVTSYFCVKMFYVERKLHQVFIILIFFSEPPLHQLVQNETGIMNLLERLLSISEEWPAKFPNSSSDKVCFNLLRNVVDLLQAPNKKNGLIITYGLRPTP